MAGPSVPLSKGGKGLTFKHYTYDSEWTCPAGVTEVILIGQGGGSGGASGNRMTFTQALAGRGSTLSCTTVKVVPNTVYSITVGYGGAGASRSYTTLGNTGSSGNPTTFGALATFSGASTVGVSNYLSTSSGFRGFAGPSYEGSTVSNYYGGQGGSPGVGAGVPSQGGNGSTTNGQDAPYNNNMMYGAGGAGGGSGPTSGGAGSSGGRGQLFVMWVE